MLKIESKIRSLFLKTKNLSAVGAGYLISNAISGIFWLFLASILEKEEYGELGYLLAIITTTGAIALVGSSNTLTVYVAKGVKIQATIFFIALVSGIIASIILLIFTQNIFVSFYPLALVIFSVVIFDFLGRKAFVNYAKYMIIQRVLMVIFSLILLQIWGIDGIILGYTLSLSCFVFLVYKGFKEGIIDFRLLKERKHFIVNNYATHVLDVVGVNIDKLIIFPMFGALILGPYQLGFQIFVIIMILPRIVTQYTLPHDATGSKNIQLKKYTIISSATITTLTIILSPFLIPLIFPKYTEIIEIIQIMGFAVIPYALTLIFTSELLGNEKSKIVAIGVIVSIITLSIGILVLGEYFGLIGMAFSLVIAKSLQCGTLFILKKSVFNVNNKID